MKARLSKPFSLLIVALAVSASVFAQHDRSPGPVLNQWYISSTLSGAPRVATFETAVPRVRFQLHQKEGSDALWLSFISPSGFPIDVSRGMDLRAGNVYKRGRNEAKRIDDTGAGLKVMLGRAVSLRLWSPDAGYACSKVVDALSRAHPLEATIYATQGRQNTYKLNPYGLRAALKLTLSGACAYEGPVVLDPQAIDNNTQLES
jgi:hypothetical protein